MDRLFNWSRIEISSSDNNIILFHLPTLLERVGDFPKGYNKLDHIKVDFLQSKITMVDEDGQELATYDFDIVI